MGGSGHEEQSTWHLEGKQGGREKCPWETASLALKGKVIGKGWHGPDAVIVTASSGRKAVEPHTPSGR